MEQHADSLKKIKQSKHIDGLEDIKKKTYSQMMLLHSWSELFDLETEEITRHNFDKSFFFGLSSFLKEMAIKSSETYEWLENIPSAT